MKKDLRRGFVFYTQDYFGATDVRLTPVDMRCVWIEMFFLMDQSPRRGVLLKKNGATYSSEDLAKVINCTVELIDQTTSYVLQEGIATRDRSTGVLTNRRMMREEKQRQMGSKFGKKGGGNPLLRKDKPDEKGGINPSKIAPKSSQTTNMEHPATPSQQKAKASIFKGTYNRGLYTTEPEPDPDPEPELGNKEGERGKGTSPGLKNAGTRSRDLASDYFAITCLEKTGTPYVPEAGDFVVLARLRQAFHTEARQMPPGWTGAVQNYFASPLSQYSLADLSNPKRYAVFKNSALDGYSKPLTHQNRRNGNERSIETKGELLIRKQREEGQRFRESLRGSTGDGDGPGDSERTDGLVRKGPVRSD